MRSAIRQPEADDESPVSMIESLRAPLTAHLLDIETVQTPDAVHDARVAIRRMRIVLRASRHVVRDALRKKCLRLLQKAEHELADLRDSDVREGLIRELLSEATVVKSAERRRVLALLSAYRQSTRRALVRRCATPGWQVLKIRCIESLRRLNYEPMDARQMRKVLSHQWERLRDRLQRPGKDPKDLHRLRLEVKATRYLTEKLAPATPSSVLKRLSDLQDTLGELNDCDALAAWLPQQSIDPSITGVISNHLDDRRKKLREGAARQQLRLRAEVARLRRESR